MSTALEDIASQDPHTDPESMSDILLEAQDALKEWKPSFGITLMLTGERFYRAEGPNIPYPIPDHEKERSAFVIHYQTQLAGKSVEEVKELAEKICEEQHGNEKFKELGRNRPRWIRELKGVRIWP
jgi:hypothetical protein